jgi:hypothetical protein
LRSRWTATGFYRPTVQTVGIVSRMEQPGRSEHAKRDNAAGAPIRGQGAGASDLARSDTGAEMLVAELADPDHKRGAYAMLAYGVRAGMAVPPELLAKALQSANIDLGDEDGRVRASARTYVSAVMKLGVDAAIAMDKVARLDEGGVTESVQLSLMPPRIARIQNEHSDPGAK